MTAALILGAAVLSGLACAERREAEAAEAGEGVRAPADSLVATVRDSTAIWFTLARRDSGDSGTCTERTIEIRRGSARVPVPLLYTGAAPEIVDDTTLRARLWNHCRGGDAYLVDLRTGQPSRERR